MQHLSSFEILPSTKAARVDIATLNEAHENIVREFFRSCCSAPMFVEAMAQQRPYTSVETILDSSDAVFAAMTDVDIDAAIAGHPRIGDKPAGSAVEDEHSRREQSSMEEAEGNVQEEIRRANAAYESRFDRVFLIRAAGRTPQEMLSEARRRMDNDPVSELAEVREQLRQITRLRLEQSLTSAEA